MTEKTMWTKPDLGCMRTGRRKWLALVLVLSLISVHAIFWNYRLSSIARGFSFGNGVDSLLMVSGLSCWSYPGNVLRELDDSEPIPGSGIFFHEVSCPKMTFDIPLSARQACVIESAAVANPSSDVFLLISSTVLVKEEESHNVLVKTLLSYSNVKIRHINFTRYLSDTPMKNLLMTDTLSKSKWPVPHASDVLRLATLYKFGGTYLDLDVLVLKPFDNMSNYAGLHSQDCVGNWILSFGWDLTGREMALDCANEISTTFAGHIWSHNGPGVITRVLRKRCELKKAQDMVGQFGKCKGFHVFPEKTFMPIPWWDIQLAFRNGNTERLSVINGSYGIHLFNNASSHYVLEKGPDVPYLKWAEKYCPKVYVMATIVSETLT